MGKNSCAIYAFEGSTFDNVIAYSISNYPGGVIPSFCKGDYILEYQSPNDNNTLFKIYVEKKDKTTKLEIISKEDNTLIIEFDESQFFIDISLCTYLLATKDEKLRYSIIKKNDVVDDKTIHNLIHIYFYASFFIYSYKTLNKKLPYVIFKNKKRKSLKRFQITKEVIDDIIKEEVPSIGSSDFTNLNVIEFSPDLFDKLYDMTKDDKTERFIYLPFEEFGVVLDEDIEIHIFTLDEKGYVLFSVFKHKTCVICIKLDINTGNYKYFFFERVKELKEIDFSYLAAYFVRLLRTVLNYVAIYKVKKEKKKISVPNNAADTFSKSSSNRIASSNVVTINTNLYNIEINDKTIKHSEKRNKPEYIKYSWERRGHVRTYKSGKKVYIGPTNCQRKSLKTGGEIPPNKHVYKIN